MTHNMWDYSRDLKHVYMHWDLGLGRLFSIIGRSMLAVYFEMHLTHKTACSLPLCMSQDSGAFLKFSQSRGNPALITLSTSFALTHKATGDGWYCENCNFLKKLQSPTFARHSLGRKHLRPRISLQRSPVSAWDFALIEAGYAILFWKLEKPNAEMSMQGRDTLRIHDLSL